MGEGIFYDDESGAPEKSADDESEVGFEGGGVGGGGRGSDGGLRMGGRLAGDDGGCNVLRERRWTNPNLG